MINTLHYLKENGVFIVAIILTILQFLPKLLPVPVHMPKNYQIEQVTIEAAIKAYKDKNFDTALSHFITLAEKGDPQSQLMAGVMYRSGKGVSSDLCQSVYWIDKAARQGEFNSQLRLSYAYDSNYAIKYDHDKAYLWLKAAKLNDDKEKYVKWFKDVTGIEDDVKAMLNVLNTFYSEADRTRLDKIFETWDYAKEPPADIRRIRYIPYINNMSFVIPDVKPCY